MTQACRGRGHFSTGHSGPRPARAALLQGSTITAIPVDQIPEGLQGPLATAPLADTLGYLHLDVDVLDPAVGHANYLSAGTEKRARARIADLSLRRDSAGVRHRLALATYSRCYCARAAYLSIALASGVESAPIFISPTVDVWWASCQTAVMTAAA